MSYHIIPLKSLPLSDNFMFGEVMSDLNLCKMFLEEVLHRKIVKIKIINREKTITNAPGLHGIRLDVYVEDEDGVRYDIEMQKGSADGKFLECRVRYYQSSIDRTFLAAGKDYRELPQSYIIFICDYDYYQKGYACYERVSFIKDCPEVAYEDGTHVVFFNTRYTVANVSEEVREFLDYIRTNDDEMFFKGKLAQTARELVRKVRADETMEVKYMTLQMLLQEKYDEAKDEGRKEGVKEGISIGRNEGISIGRNEGISIGRNEGISIGINKGMAMGKESALQTAIRAIADIFSPEEIAKRFNVPTDFVKSALNNA